MCKNRFFLIKKFLIFLPKFILALMKKITCFLTIIFLLLSAFPSLHAQSTQEKEFWLTFGKNLEAPIKE